nr:multiple-epitope polypeptide 1 [synthetic construct]
MGTNLSVPNPLGFLPDHQLDPAFGANSTNPDWDFNPGGMQWNSTALHQALQDPRVRGLYLPAGGFFLLTRILTIGGCTTPAQGNSMFPSCCCTKPTDGNC